MSNLVLGITSWSPVLNLPNVAFIRLAVSKGVATVHPSDIDLVGIVGHIQTSGKGVLQEPI